jgi:hypothetical protein
MTELQVLPDPQSEVKMHLRAFCFDCGRFHDIHTSPGTPLVRELSSWEYKHRGHQIEFTSPKRIIPRNLDDSLYEKLGKAPWWLEGMKENTNFQLAFVASVAMTLTSLASLASSSTLLAGASALAVDNGASGSPLEIGVSGVVKNGTTPTTNREIDIYAYAALDDTPTYPDTLAGTDAAKTLTTVNILNTGLRLLQSMLCTATSNEVNPFAPVALSAMFGVMPRKWSVWVTHNCVAALNSSGHAVNYKGVYVAG